MIKPPGKPGITRHLWVFRYESLSASHRRYWPRRSSRSDGASPSPPVGRRTSAPRRCRLGLSVFARLPPREASSWTQNRPQVGYNHRFCSPKLRNNRWNLDNLLTEWVEHPSKPDRRKNLDRRTATRSCLLSQGRHKAELLTAPRVDLQIDMEPERRPFLEALLLIEDPPLWVLLYCVGKAHGFSWMSTAGQNSMAISQLTPVTNQL